MAFTNVSGTTGFGIHPSSTMAEGTYSSIISGLSSSDITSGTSGIHSNSNACSDVNANTVMLSSDCAELDINGEASDITIDSGVTVSGTGDYDWVLNNSSGTTWDLLSTAQLDDAVNTGTNIPSIATPNGQAAFLFLLTSSLAPLINLSYLKMVKMALPYTIILTIVGLYSITYLL